VKKKTETVMIANVLLEETVASKNHLARKINF
jgi:hypothetical protein